jgi:hypothetical protein
MYLNKFERIIDLNGLFATIPFLYRYSEDLWKVFLLCIFVVFCMLCTSTAPLRPAHGTVHPRLQSTQGLAEFRVQGRGGFEPGTTELQSGAHG